jgi:predicted outer membrane protein
MLLRRAALLTILVLTSGCKGKKEESAPARTGAPKPAAQAPAKPRFSESEAAQILLAVDSDRIASATAVRGLSQSEAVLEYVRVMLADHQAASALIESLLARSGTAPTDNTTSQLIRQETQQFVTQLLARDSGINNSYLSHEVQNHEKALMLLDTALIPSAQDSALKLTLQQLRPMFEAHYQQARRIQDARAAAASQKAQGVTQPGITPPGQSPAQTPAPTRTPTPAPPPKLLGVPIKPDTVPTRTTTNNI